MGAAVTARRRARELVLRILYQAEINAEPISDVIDEARAHGTPGDPVVDYAAEIARAVEEKKAGIDAKLRAISKNWSLERMASVDRNVLRAAVAELMTRPDVDARVILDEAIEIAAAFGTEGSGGFVNGLLDPLAREIRPGELES